jgi:hypothetical protein
VSAREAHDRHVFACRRIFERALIFALPFKPIRVMTRHAPNLAQKMTQRINMTNAETNAAASVTEQGAHVAPEKASPKNPG